MRFNWLKGLMTLLGCCSIMVILFPMVSDVFVGEENFTSRRIRIPETSIDYLYNRMVAEKKIYTVKEAAVELKISEGEAQRLLDWLSSLEREVEPNAKFKGIEKVTIKGETVYRFLTPEMINRDIFRDYDYRSPNQGDIDFAPKRLFFMTLTWVSMALEKAKTLGIDNRKVVIARDCRKTLPAAIEAMIKAVEYSGLQAIYVGKIPNAAASYAWAVRKHNPLMGVFLTASHVKGDNVMGAKVSIRGGANELESLTTQEIKEISHRRLEEILRDPNRLGLIQSKPILRIVDDVEPTYNQMAQIVGLVATKSFKSSPVSLYQLARDLEEAGDGILDVLNNYILRLNLDAKPLEVITIVIEGAGTPSGQLAAKLFKTLGAKVILLHGEIQELSGQHKADPSIVENLNELMAKMKETNAHLGIAFDLDGDRGAVVVPIPEKDPITKDNFTVLPPDNLMEVLLPFFNSRGYSVKERNKVAIVRDVLSTKGVDKKAKELGYESYQTDAGYVFLKAKVKSLKENDYTIPIYAERSGHAWTHVTGAFEDPIVVSLFFTIMVSEYLQKNPKANFPALEVYKENTIPYKQSTRFQPLFGENFLRELSEDPGNKSGWRFGQIPIPMEIIALGRHKAIEQLKAYFQKGKSFNTPAGELVVSEFNFYFDPEAKINRFADIRFNLNGKDAGSFVFRASSNDPTWVCAFETPLWDGESFASESLRLRYISVGGLVLDYLENSGIARITGTGFSYPNKSDAEETLNMFRKEMGK